MFSLSLHERILIAVFLSATVLGVAAKHWRDARREGVSPLHPGVTDASVPGDPSRNSFAQIPAARPQP